jgi:hypothetical protein
MVRRFFTWFAVLAFLTPCLHADVIEEGVSLLQGADLDGWTVRGGKHDFAVEDGAVVGTCVAGQPNGFLCTDRVYTNFVLTMEIFPHPELNSGVQIRSNQYDHETTATWKNDAGETKTKKIPAGRVHGYQVEIDPTPRAFSGGIYDEGRRGWLDNPKDDEAARKAFELGTWNLYRIEARGPSIKTWVNGVPVADLTDDMTPAGFIGLQVHSSKNPGAQVKWRNLRIEELP